MTATPHTIAALRATAAARHAGRRAIATMDASLTHGQLHDLWTRATCCAAPT